MKFIKTNELNEIVYAHGMPFDSQHGLGKTEEQLLDEGFLVEAMPEAPQLDGKVSITKFDGTDFYFEYTDRELTDSERITQLEMMVLDLSMMIGGV